MKTGWELKKLGDVCIVERGSSPRPIKEYITDDANGVNWIKIGDTKGVNKYIYTTKEKITVEGSKKSRYVEEGDFILTNSMSFGKPYIMKTNGYIHDGWFVLRLKKTIDTEYFYYLLTSPLVQKQFDELSSGAIVKNISSDLVKKAIVPVPPLSEQQRIVAILDDAFEAIAKAKENAEKNMRNARELFESVLESVFANSSEGWEKCALDKYVNFIDYRGKTPLKTNNGVRLITAKNVKGGYLQREPEEFINSDAYDSWMTRGIPNFGDVLFTTEAPLGNVAQLDIDEKVAFAQRIIILQPDIQKITQSFLKYLLLSRPMKNQILGKGTGATVQGIKARLLRKIQISFPKTEVQKDMVYRLYETEEKTKKLESIYKQKLANLDELKKSILQKAFAGEL